ncbi:MAG: tetratricopeptide repeat protein [Crocinitomicaceae bacterium]|nr:tetratricopeptide repeat protein [Crocinitomicaceae bacterium]
MTHIEIDNLAEQAWNLRLSKIQIAYQSGLSLIEISESMNYLKGIADSCKTLGYCYWRFSDYSLSLAHSLRAIDIYRQLGDKSGEADTLNNIGAVYMFQNDHEKRLEVNIRCKQIRSEIGDLEGATSSEGNIGETYLEMGNLPKAEACFRSVLDDPNASPQGLSWAYHNLGRVFQTKEKWTRALDFYTLGLELSESVDYRVLITDSYLAIVELFIIQKKYDEALKNAEKALSVSRKIGAKEGEKKSLYFLSKIYEYKGFFEQSLKYHKTYHSLELEISRDTEIERLKTTQLRVAFEKIEDQKNELIASIKYAKKIQKAVLNRNQENTLLDDYFVIFEPKDIVSGDFYWYYEKNDHFYLGVADCTGHGVPGAFLTLLGTTFMNEIISGDEYISPSDLLDELRTRFIQALNKVENNETRDGMDISLIRINKTNLTAQWAGANNPIWIARGKEDPFITSSRHNILEENEFHLMEIKGDKQPIGLSERLFPFKNNRVQLKEGDTIYLFSDGIVDQFGGPKGKKYKSTPFKKRLLSLQNEPIKEQGEIIEKDFLDWKGSQFQVDDVCVLGFRI